ncbi:MAG: 1-acyl-sn-glycerol-3-phosphate acyltransferase [Chitinispirillaceae bacterium]|nr:1-acyl-sn-glycerol-3-phosphate acyltransferase [Chitinispirillaceae bacterium]
MATYHENVGSVIEGVGTFFKRNFTDIVISGPDVVPQDIQKNPVMLVSTHRSHLDYFLIGSRFFEMGFENLRFAAGSNLTNLPYIGKRFRNFGAFAVERDTGFERNYVRNLCNSVVSMMQRREAIIVFPEGGRSYSGRMLDVKAGILGASVLTRSRNPDIDVQLLPIAVTYEFPPDLPWFELLLKGKQLRKRDKNFFQKILGSIYYFGADICAFAPLMFSWLPQCNRGKIFIDYSAPVKLSTIVDVEKNRASQARDDFSANRQSMQIVSDAMSGLLYKLYRILPQHIVAAIVAVQNKIEVDEALGKCDEILKKVRSDERNTLLIDSMSNEQIIQEGIEKLTAIKALNYKAGVLLTRSQSMIDYFAATIQ